MMKTKLILCLLVLTMACAFTGNDGLDDLRWLDGTWKAEKKQNFESWKRAADGSYSGESYDMKKGTKKVSEQLAITVQGENIVYTATVLDQNNGKPVAFVLNKDVKNKFSFENLAHDFPKKIQYTVLDKMTLKVEVLGADDKGFSYKMMRQ